MANLIEKVFGTHSERELKHIYPIVDKIEALSDRMAAMSDEEAIKALSSIKGIGRWTAEMILIFSLQRLDVLSYDDLGLRRGLCLIYHHRQLTPKLYAKYKRRFSPYGSVASLYIWEVSGGGLPELNHPKTANQGSEK